MSEDPAVDDTHLNEADVRDEIKRAKEGFRDVGQSSGPVTEALENVEEQGDA
jgi:hypothetical protein